MNPEKLSHGHPDTQSIDLVAQNIEQLKQIFPEVIKEGKIDFDALKDVLGDYTDTPEERFGLNWAGKSNARREAQKRSTGTLRPCPEESVDWDSTQNLYLEGDNLEVLKLLQKSYNNKVKMIYIDPPYNTGKDFVYKDNYTDNMANYFELTGQDKKLATNTESDGRYHSNWLNMMYPRLKLARNLLTDDGVIFISIDDNEVHNLREVCNEIFGEENFIGCFIWEKRKTRENRSVLSIRHDYILSYAKNIISSDEIIGLTPMTEDALDRYKNPDNDYRGLWTSVPAIAQAGHGTKSQFYTLTTPSGKVVELQSGNCWRYTFDKMQEEIRKNNIWFGADGNGVPRIKKFLSEGRQGLTPETIWFADYVGTNDTAKRTIVELFDGLVPFETPKPHTLIMQMIKLNINSNAIILDFFSGSATTAHAVMQLNAEDNGNRKYIMVQLPEATEETSEAYKAGYKNICEIGKERIRRAGKKILEEQKAKQAKEGLFQEETAKLDTGFKVFKLDSSNINTWDGTPEDIEGKLFKSIQNIKTNRTEHDLLYEILLKYGIDLSQPINEYTLDNKKVYEMGAGSLIICMADSINVTTAEAIAKLWKQTRPEVKDEDSVKNTTCRVVFKDNGFMNNNDKTNTLQTLKQQGIANVVTI